MDANVSQLIGGTVTIVAGALTSVVTELLQKYSKFIDGLNGRVKQTLVLALAFGVTKVNALLGLTLPVDVTGWSADVINTLITAGVSFGAYNLFKTKTSATA